MAQVESVRFDFPLLFCSLVCIRLVQCSTRIDLVAQKAQTLRAKCYKVTIEIRLVEETYSHHDKVVVTC